MTADPERVALLAEADLFLLLARLLHPADEAGIEFLSAMAEEADQVFGSMRVAEPGSLARCLRDLALVAREAGHEALRDEQIRLHEGAVRCPINETAYVRRDKGPILADVAGFYRAFALEHDREWGEKLDHLATELEFVALLLVLEAQALEKGLDEDRTTTRNALGSFVGDHLGCFLPGFTASLARATSSPFHVRLADFLDLWWEDFCARRALVVPVMPAWDEAGEPSSSFECGHCPTPPDPA